MCRKLFFPICLVLVLGLTTAVGAAGLLASYERSEVNDLEVLPDSYWSPTLEVNWPVRGGVNGVPEATEGEYVLKLEWADETDCNVEISHNWKDFTFDLAGENYMLADVYLATESAMPAVMGIWDGDLSLQWISADCVPCTINEWYTIPYNVAALNDVNVGYIQALVFAYMNCTAGTAGTIYIDNLRLGSLDDVIRRQISFAGYNWLVKDSGCSKHGPGPNYFSHSKENVWVDANDYLHLKIAQRCEKWFCSEVILDASPGYGTYIFTTEGRVDLFDPNIVLGLFTWDTDAPHHHYREIDIELSRWWEANEPNNAQFVVQPWNNPGNRHRFRIDLNDWPHESTTHEISWRPDQIDFRSYYGDCPLRDVNDLIESWTYSGHDIPPAGGENARINFWLLPPKNAPYGTPAPTDGNEAEIVIKSFRYLPNITATIDILPRTLNLTSKGWPVICVIRLGEGYDVGDIDSRYVFLEDTIKAERVLSFGRKRTAIAMFSRSKVQEAMSGLEVPCTVELTVRGQLIDGTRFKGSDTIRVIDQRMRRPVRQVRMRRHR